MAQIIRTCNAGLAALLALAVAAAPATAQQRNDRLGLYLSARGAEAIGDEDRAAMLYGRLLERDPANPVIVAEAMGSAITTGRFDLARAVAKNADVRQFDLQGRLFLIADALAREDDAAALSVLSDDAAQANVDFVAPFVRGWIDVASRRPATRERGIRTVTGIGEDAPMAAFVAEQAAYMHLANKDPAAAAPFIERALPLSAGRETALRIAFADGLAKAGDSTAAQALLAGDNPSLAAARGRLEQGQSLGFAVDTPAKAFSQLLLALAIDVNRGQRLDLPLALTQISRAADGKNAQAAIVTALLLHQLDRSDEALPLLSAIPAKHLLASSARDSEVQVLMQTNRLNRALAIAQEGVRQTPDAPGVHGRVGDVLGALDRHAEAADAYARERGGSLDDWTLLFLEGAQRNDAGQWEAAETLLRHALAASPDQPLVLNYLGYTMLERGENLEEATAMIARAHKLRPDNASITDSLGWAQYKMGEIDKAVETLGQAVAQESANAEIYEHYGDALFAAGYPIEARFAWGNARRVADEDEGERVVRLDSKLAHGLSKANAAP
ncbi:tetratricopeptide repeat protein [Sphingomicrobium marinum]|uniref:tetratricopeptide repeat protein n=1 Tax=Sphingomicrobium marinum TaxID=1227950 RepID=UPI00223F7611|nr:tetratricopeptide repeat protein [Sphingomicrobium marinum]